MAFLAHKPRPGLLSAPPRRESLDWLSPSRLTWPAKNIVHQKNKKNIMNDGTLPRGIEPRSPALVNAWKAIDKRKS
jgi:hypothetical protein